MKIKKVILLGRKHGVLEAARYLLSKNIQIAYIIGDKNDRHAAELEKLAGQKDTPFYYQDDVLYNYIQKKDSSMLGIDLVISYLYSRKIKEPLIKLAKTGCINFHPAPLPDYKGRAGYNTAILDGKNEFGVTAHFIDNESFDVGPIIAVNRFPIDPATENALSLERKTQKELLNLFKQTIDTLLISDNIKTTENKGGIYLNKKQLEELKVIDPVNDSAETVDKKIRAFFFPPYHGAKINIHGKDYTLVNEEMLKYLNELIHE